MIGLRCGQPQVARGRVPVVAGTGSNSTAEAIDFTRHAKKAGADACLVVSPYYNKPTQEGLFLHFTAIADAVDLPMVVYNIPPRSVVDIAPDTMARLAKHPNIVGVVDFGRSDKVHHCNYFLQPETVRAIRSALQIGSGG